MNRHRPGRIARRLLRAPARLYDWRCGWLLGHRFLRLTHVGRSRFRPVHRTLNVEEAVAALTDYERRNRLITPVIRRVLSWLVDWRYDGSGPARRRLARELPIVAFRPAHHGGSAEDEIAAQ